MFQTLSQLKSTPTVTPKTEPAVTPTPDTGFQTLTQLKTTPTVTPTSKFQTISQLKTQGTTNVQKVANNLTLPENSNLGIGGNQPKPNKTGEMLPSIPPDVKDALKQTFPQTIQATKELNSAQPKEILNDTWNAIKIPFQQAVQQISQSTQDTSETPKSKVVADVLNNMTSTLGVLLSPFNAGLTFINDIPKISILTRLVSIPFIALGEATKKDSDLLMDNIPMDSKDRENLKPAIGNTLSLISQLALGKLVVIKSEKAAPIIKKFGEEKFNQLTKDITIENGLSHNIRLTPEDIKAINLGTNVGENAELVKGLGLSSKEWVDAVKNGLSIDIPGDKITHIIDKPYWEKVKNIFGKASTEKTIVTPGEQSQITPFGGYLTEEAGKVEIPNVNYVEPKVYAESLPNTKPGGEVSISKITVPDRIAGEVDPNQISANKISISNGDKINPIVVDQNNVLLDGYHRLETLKEMGVKNVQVVVQNTPKSQGVIPEVKTNKTATVKSTQIDNVKTIKDVKISIKSIANELDNLVTEAKGIAEVAKEQRYGLNTNNIAKLKRIYKTSKVFQEGDIETIRNSKHGELLDNVLEDLAIKYPSLGEQELFDMAINMPNKSLESVKNAPELKILRERQKTLQKYLDQLKTKQAEFTKQSEITKANEVYDEWQQAINAQEKLEKIINVSRSQLPVGEGKETVSRLEARVKKSLDAVDQETIDKLGLSTFNQMNNKEAIAKASEYVIKNPDDAIKVLTGELQPPKGIPINAIYVAMVNNSYGNVELATKLATLKSTRFGQEIEILKEIDKNSPVKVISDVIKIREAEFKKTHGGQSVKQATEKEVQSIKNEIKKVIPKADAWMDFVRSIDCGGAK